jgi:hypothetical protein
MSRGCGEAQLAEDFQLLDEWTMPNILSWWACLACFAAAPLRHGVPKVSTDMLKTLMSTFRCTRHSNVPWVCLDTSVQSTHCQSLLKHHSYPYYRQQRKVSVTEYLLLQQKRRRNVVQSHGSKPPPQPPANRAFSSDTSTVDSSFPMVSCPRGGFVTPLKLGQQGSHDRTPFSDHRTFSFGTTFPPKWNSSTPRRTAAGWRPFGGTASCPQLETVTRSGAARRRNLSW